MAQSNLEKNVAHFKFETYAKAAIAYLWRKKLAIYFYLNSFY
jgi:hypothetical protein